MPLKHAGFACLGTLCVISCCMRQEIRTHRVQSRPIWFGLLIAALASSLLTILLCEICYHDSQQSLQLSSCDRDSCIKHVFVCSPFNLLPCSCCACGHDSLPSCLSQVAESHASSALKQQQLVSSISRHMQTEMHGLHCSTFASKAAAHHAMLKSEVLP